MKESVEMVIAALLLGATAAQLLFSQGAIPPIKVRAKAGWLVKRLMVIWVL